jgi:hypothetical protein
LDYEGEIDMKITAVTQDQLIIIDGTPALMGKIGGYNMERGEWAVQFDTLTGAGHIEYLDARANQIINQAYFDKHYAWLQDEHKKYQDYLKAEEEAEKAKQTEQTEQAK